MQDKILELINQYGGLSYDALLKFLKCAPTVLAEEIAKIENEKIYKVGKNYVIINGDDLVRGKVIYKNDTFYLVSEDKRYFIDKNYWNNIYAKDEVIANVEEDFLGRVTAYILKVVSGEGFSKEKGFLQSTVLEYKTSKEIFDKVVFNSPVVVRYEVSNFGAKADSVQLKENK